LNFWLQARMLSGTFHATLLLFTNWRRHWWVEDLRMLHFKNNCRLLCIVSSWLRRLLPQSWQIFFGPKMCQCRKWSTCLKACGTHMCVNSSIRWAYTCRGRHMHFTCHHHSSATLIQKWVCVKLNSSCFNTIHHPWRWWLLWCKMSKEFLLSPHLTAANCEWTLELIISAVPSPSCS
jgi:hypothetical protein